MEEGKGRLCPACGAALELKLRGLPIGADGGGGLISAMMRDQYGVDLYACPKCGKVELYTAFFEEKSAQPEEVVCPVCGSRHSPLIGCPSCALRNAQSGQTYRSEKKTGGKKFPWEK